MRCIAIIGAGVTGVTTAYALVRRGYKVTVYDRNRYAAMETSFANGGQLSASNSEVWNNWASISKGLRWMLRADAPLLFNLKPSWHKYSWIAEFLLATREYKQNTQETVRLAILARKHLSEIAQEEGIEFNHSSCGILHFYNCRKDFEKAKAINKVLCAAGLERREVDGHEVKKIEPSLKQDYVGGFFTAGDASGDIHRFTRDLTAACRRHGAEFIFDTDVERLKVNRTSVSLKCWSKADPQEPVVADHDAVVICAGVGSRKYASQVGDRVNVYPVKGYSITVPLKDSDNKAAAPKVSLLDEEAKIVTSRLGDDRYRVAGTAEINGYSRDIRQDRIRPLSDWVNIHHPGLDTSGAVPWAGLRPMMPNMMPRATRGKSDRVFYNTGHGHLGWTLCAATADIIAEIVSSQTKEVRTSPLPILKSKARASTNQVTDI
ncbi:MAG: D-amino acid dehydrogenase [Pseudomonadota bacterium]